MVIATTIIRNMALLVICQFEITFNWGQILKTWTLANFQVSPDLRNPIISPPNSSSVAMWSISWQNVGFRWFSPYLTIKGPTNHKENLLIFNGPISSSLTPSSLAFLQILTHFLNFSSTKHNVSFFFVRNNSWSMMVGWLEILYQTTRPRSIGKHTVSLNFQKSTSFSLPKKLCLWVQWWWVLGSELFWSWSYEKWRRDGSV